MSRPLLPLQEKPLTPREAADCLRGLAEMVETYPAASLLLSLDITVAQSDTPVRKRKPAKSSSTSS